MLRSRQDAHRKFFVRIGVEALFLIRLDTELSHIPALLPPWKRGIRNSRLVQFNVKKRETFDLSERKK